MSHRKHVLVVDDDNMQIMIMRRIFERHGLRVSTAADGRDALLQIAAKDHPSDPHHHQASAGWPSSFDDHPSPAPPTT